mmetsp:Transcript_82582/g.165027  ORF Transcript_82582/g.165027 Transcript_82582/m.165027 type:complete len:118 (-) Transcript_82582:225-578(-)
MRTRLEVFGEGTGGLKELVAFMSSLPTVVSFGCLAVPCSDSSGSQRLKLVTVLFSPPAATARQRATAANHKGALLSSVLLGTHLVLEVDDVGDLTAQAVVTRLIASGGAHAANSFSV